MTIPFTSYRTRLQLMFEEALPPSKVMSDWPLGDTIPPWWVIRLSGVRMLSRINVREALYSIRWQAKLVRGGIDASNKGQMATVVLTDVSLIMEYFQDHSDMLTTTQSRTDKIPFYMTDTLLIESLGDSEDVKNRVEGYSIQFNHRNKICT